MRYLMFVCTDPSAEKYDPAQDTIQSWVSEMDGRGVRILGNRLGEPDQAVTVRKRNGKVIRTDGPFAETKEWIAGFDILECKSLDEAIEIAAKHPMARFGRIEVRPFWSSEL
ncbi:MAG: YciI family protein [Spirochaetia bacterium]